MTVQQWLQHKPFTEDNYVAREGKLARQYPQINPTVLEKTAPQVDPAQVSLWSTNHSPASCCTALQSMRQFFRGAFNAESLEDWTFLREALAR